MHQPQLLYSMYLRVNTIQNFPQKGVFIACFCKQQNDGEIFQYLSGVLSIIYRQYVIYQTQHVIIMIIKKYNIRNKGNIFVTS